MLAAWVAVVLFLVALPLFAWWLGGRRFLDRPTGGAEAAALGRAVAQRHGLQPVQAELVKRAVTWGRELAEPELRAAAVDWAQQLLELDRRRRAARPRPHAGVVIGLTLWVTAVLAFVAFAVAQGRWDDVNWGNVLVYAGLGVWGWRLRTGPRRAIDRNSGPPSSS